jgi:hypothetical protein
MIVTIIITCTPTDALDIHTTHPSEPQAQRRSVRARSDAFGDVRVQGAVLRELCHHEVALRQSAEVPNLRMDVDTEERHHVRVVQMQKYHELLGELLDALTFEGGEKQTHHPFYRFQHCCRITMRCVPQDHDLSKVGQQ